MNQPFPTFAEKADLLLSKSLSYLFHHYLHALVAHLHDGDKVALSIVIQRFLYTCMMRNMSSRKSRPNAV